MAGKNKRGAWQLFFEKKKSIFFFFQRGGGFFFFTRLKNFPGWFNCLLWDKKLAFSNQKKLLEKKGFFRNLPKKNQFFLPRKKKNFGGWFWGGETFQIQKTSKPFGLSQIGSNLVFFPLIKKKKKFKKNPEGKREKKRGPFFFPGGFFFFYFGGIFFFSGGGDFPGKNPHRGVYGFGKPVLFAPRAFPQKRVLFFLGFNKKGAKTSGGPQKTGGNFPF